MNTLFYGFVILVFVSIILLIEAGYVVPIEPRAVVLEDHAVAVRELQPLADGPQQLARFLEG